MRGVRFLVKLILATSIALIVGCASRKLPESPPQSRQPTAVVAHQSPAAGYDTGSVDEMMRRRLELSRKLNPTLEDIRESLDLAKRIGVAKGYWTKKEFEDFAYSKPGPSAQPGSASPQHNNPTAITSERTPEEDQIVERVSADLPGLKRTALKVIIGQPATDPEAIRSRLLEVAAKQDADVVRVHGFFTGEKWDKVEPAGILEYGRNGHGWKSESKVPPEGVFTWRIDLTPRLGRVTSSNVAEERGTQPTVPSTANAANYNEPGIKCDICGLTVPSQYYLNAHRGGNICRRLSSR